MCRYLKLCQSVPFCAGYISRSNNVQVPVRHMAQAHYSNLIKKEKK